MHVHIREWEAQTGLVITLLQFFMLFLSGVSFLSFVVHPNFEFLLWMLYYSSLSYLANLFRPREKCEPPTPCSGKPVFRFSRLADSPSEQDEVFLAKSKYYFDRENTEPYVQIPKRPADMPWRLSKLEDQSVPKLPFDIPWWLSKPENPAQGKER